VLTITGKNEPTAIKMTFDNIPIPNHTINNGRTASKGIVYPPATKGLNTCAAVRNLPINSPPRTPTEAPKANPSISCSRLTPKSDHKGPLARSIRLLATVIGEGRKSELITCKALSAHQSRTKTITPETLNNVVLNFHNEPAPFFFTEMHSGFRST
jgi:hypothetical protein